MKQQREARTVELRVRYTQTEKDEIEKAAGEVGLMTSEFVRMAIASAVKNGVKIPKLLAPRGQSLHQQEVMNN